MEDFYTFIEIVVIFAIGYYVGVYVTVMKMLNLYAQLTGSELSPEDIKNVGNEELEEVYHVFQTETHNNVLYLYNKDTDLFVCQASSFEELCKLCKELTKCSDIFVIHDDESYYYNGSVLKKIVITK